MTIQPDKETRFKIFFPFFMFAFIGILFQYAFHDWYFTGIFLLVCGMIAVKNWIDFGRTFLLEENGITISFLWITKTIPWSQFRYKRLYNRENALGSREISRTGVEFSPFAKPRPSFLTPATYCSLLLNSFSYVFIYFKQVQSYGKHNTLPEFYVADENVVFAVMERSGVELENCRKSKK